MSKIFGAFVFLLFFFTSLSFAQEERFTIGGDEYVSGNQAAITTPVDRDAFAAGFNVHLSGPISGDAHAAGFSVTIDSDVKGDVYAAGNSVTIKGRVEQDVSASGASVSLSGSKGVAGNVRLAGGNVVVATPVSGAITLAAGAATIDATIAGDLFFVGDTINFSNQALVLGHVTIKSSSDVSVPLSVASADRVTIEKIEPNEMAFGVSEIAQQSVKGFWPIWMPVIAAMVICIIVGIIWLTLFKKRSQIAYRVAMAKPWKSLLYGILGLATFLGLIPAVAMTIIGIPLVPVAIIALIIAGLIGYIAGAWFIATKVLDAFSFGSETVGKRVVALIVGLVIAWIFSLVPILGWLVQLALVYLGLGAISLAALARWTDADFHAAITKEVTNASATPD